MWVGDLKLAIRLLLGWSFGLSLSRFCFGLELGIGLVVGLLGVVVGVLSWLEVLLVVVVLMLVLLLLVVLQMGRWRLPLEVLLALVLLEVVGAVYSDHYSVILRSKAARCSAVDCS